MNGRTKYAMWMVWAAALTTELVFWFFVAIVFLFGEKFLPTLRYHLPQYTWLLFLLPLYSAFFTISVWRKNRSIKRLSEPHLVPVILPKISTTRAVLKYMFIRMGLACVIIALIDPKFGTRMEEVKSKGIDIMIALDVSNSMLAEDVTPNRLERAKLSIEQLLEKLHGDRIGIVVFAGNAFVQLPITNDYGAARMFAQTIDTKSVTEQGTAVGNAIRLCTESFDEKSPAQKVIIVVTDGENHEGDAIEAATTALTNHKISVYTIGIGTAEGTVIPIYSGDRRVGFKEDDFGQPVVSKLDENLLREIAQAGGGSFTRVVNTYSGLSDVIKNLSQKEKVELAKKEFTDYEHRFGWFICAGLLLLILDSLLAARKGTWTHMLNIFEP